MGQHGSGPKGLIDETCKQTFMTYLKRYADWILCLIILICSLWGCGGQELPRADRHPTPIAVVSWPEADRLFRQDSRWLGADDAYSIDLKDGRILWLFGDSFIAPTAEGLRSKAAIIRNSVGIQTGSDPSRAGMRFYWRGENQSPRSFFPEHGTIWFWPGNGIKIGTRLVIFLMAVGYWTVRKPGEPEVAFRALSEDQIQINFIKVEEKPAGTLIYQPPDSETIYVYAHKPPEGDRP